MRKLFIPALLFCLSASAQKTPVALPYEQHFDTSASLDDFIVINGNGDDDTWVYNPMIHCAKNSTAWSPTDSDDWLLLPLQLEAKASYNVSFVIYGAAMSVERFDLWLGTAPTKGAMTRQLIETKEVKIADQNSVQRAQFSVEESGVYYLAFHDCTEVNQGTIFLDDIMVTEVPNVMPAAPSDVQLVPGEKGKRECDVTFTLPTETLNGAPLESINEVRVYRNDILARKFEAGRGDDLTPGATLHFLDTDLSNRLYTYKIVALSDDGQEGGAALKDVYVGLDTPKQITNLQVREDVDHPGTILLTWDAPTEGVHGGYIDPKGIKYTISKGYDNEFDVSEPHYEDHLVVPDKQSYVAYSVYSHNEVGGLRTEWLTMSTQYGPSMVAPWSETFPNASVKNGPWLTHVTSTTAVGDASWYSSTPFDDMPDQNGDNGYTYFFTSNTGRTARYVSPKVDIRQLSTPTLSFWLYEHGPSTGSGQSQADVVDVAVMPEMREWEPLATITLDEVHEGWKRFTFDLSAYKDQQFIQVGFEGTSNVRTQQITALDNVSIRNGHDRDLSVSALLWPSHLDVGGRNEPFEVTVRNEGNEPVSAGDYSVSLYRAAADALAPSDADEKVASLGGRQLDIDLSATFVLEDHPGVFDADAYNYYVRVDYAADENAANDVTAFTPVRIVKPAFPVPDGLAATSGEGGVQLSWAAPAFGEGSALPVTDTFEEYGIFDIDNFGDWTVYDADHQYTVTMAFTIGSEVQVLDYPNIGLPMAWQCFSSLDAGIPYGSWEAHSGDLMMVAMGNAKNEDGTYHDNDDWLISPTLSGRAQTISFYAKCGMGTAYQPEVLEVLYSTDDATDPAAFKPVADPIELYNVSAWDEYAVELPEGAKRFALRCRSQHKFALLLDDVTYQPAGTAELKLEGYNVYRNLQRLNDDVLPTPLYNDAAVEDGAAYEYCVTAVYDKGESVPSDVLRVNYDASGISTVVGDTLFVPAYDLNGRPATGKEIIRINSAGRKSLK